MDYVIVGNSAAAIGAIEGIRSVDAEGKIILFSDEPYHTYSRPLISYYLYGKVMPDKMYYRDMDFYSSYQVEARLGTKVDSLQTAQQTVTLDSGECVKYDRLLLATGGKPIVPPLVGKEQQGVSTFLKWDDAKALDETLTPGAKVVVIGAGLIGLKATEALVSRGVQVTVVELANRVLSAILDETAAGMVQQSLEAQGVRFELQNTVAEIMGDEEGRVASVRLQDGTVVPCERVVVAIGVSPNHALTQNTEITVNRGIIVDEHMETTVNHIYAAGDVAEGYDIIYRQARVLPILPNAYKQGFNAGVNMAGGSSEYRGGFAMNSIGFFGLSMITAGIVQGGPEYTELVNVEAQERKYKKIVLRDNKIVGFITLNQVDRAGILTGLMEKEIDVSEFQELLLREDFGYVDLPAHYRQEEMLKEGISHERD